MEKTLKRSPEKKSFIFDTSALISLASIDLLKRVVNFSSITTTDAVMQELNDFSKHKDDYGNISKKVLILKNKFLIRSAEAKEEIRYLEDTDNELFNLSKNTNIPLITDDHKIVHHTEKKIEVYFSTFFLIAFVAAGLISKKEALEMLERLRDIRNWQSNIIYLTTIDQIRSM
ncbi:hypothetical protein KY366_06995 [Candidatus Woesearchaeota archaeon]|nr:hypothetical protein [Candidatus Woesearchaeota archaeon]